MSVKPGPKAPVTAPPLDFAGAPERGWPRVVWFAERFLKVPKGVGAKQAFILRPWQVDIVRAMLPTLAEAATRPLQGLISLPRGNGKTGLAAVLALYALFADEVEGAQVLVVASDERQAGHVLRAARRMIELSPELAARTQFYADRIYLPHTDSEMRALPADVGALQGWDPTLMIVDELHVVTEAVWEAVTTAAGKRPNTLTLAISTPADSADSVMWKLVQYGREGADPAEFVYVEHAAPDGCALDDEDAWAIGNPALDDFLERKALRAQLRTIRESSFRRYRLGQWVGAANVWLPIGAWDELADPARVVGPRERVVLAFDGSTSGDSTVLIGATVSEAPHVCVVDKWEDPDPHHRTGWRVPRDQVDRAVDSAFKRFNVVELAGDPWGYQSELQAWAKRHGAKRVLEYNTAHAGRMAPATDLTYAAVMEHKLTHDGDERMAAHFAHAVARDTPAGTLIAKDRRNSPRKIDSAVATIVAVERAIHHANKRGRTVSFAA